MIGQTVSHYKILEKIGEGGMGIVYKARDTKLDRHVAIKFLSPHLTKSEDAKKRFVREAKAASALDHPNIGTIYEIDELPDRRMFIAMAYYDGENLSQRLNKGPLETSQAIDVVLQVADGLSKAHENNIVHRDIKPANLILTKDGRTKIVDFGLAKFTDRSKITKTGSAPGTVAYMSPEQLRGEEADSRSDIFSLGVVLYELLAGAQPFRGEHEAALAYQIVNEAPESVSEHNPGLPSGLQRVLTRALEKDRNRRYESIDEFISDLKNFRQVRGPRWRLNPRRSGIVVAVALIMIIGYLSTRVSVPFQTSREPAFVIAIAPFWGPTDRAMDEGRVMQALVEQEIYDQIGHEEDVTLVSRGFSSPPRRHEEAQATGEQLGATLVIWGEVIMLHDEVQIEPHIAMTKSVEDQPAEVLRASLSEPNQISLRRSKAKEIRNLALLIAGNYYRWRDPEKALSLLEEIAPPSAGSYRAQAYIALDANRLEDAERLFNGAVAIDSTDAGALRGLLYVFRGLANQPHFIPASEFKRLEREGGRVRVRLRDLEQQKGSSQDRRNYAALADLGNWGPSFVSDSVRGSYIAELKRAIQNNADATWAHHRLAFLYEQGNDYEAAVSEEKKFIASMYAKNSPDDSTSASEGHSALVRLYFRQRQYDKSAAVQTWLIENKDRITSRREFLTLADIHLAQSKYDEAMAQVEKHIEANPEDASKRYRYLANVYYLQGQYDQAAAELQRILEMWADGQERESLEHNIQRDHLRYFLSLYRAGREEEAETHIADFSKQFPPAESIDWFGITPRFYAGEVSEDSLLMERSVGEDRYYLGMAHLLGLGSASVDTTVARSYFEACLGEPRIRLNYRFFGYVFLLRPELHYATWELQALDSGRD